MALSRFYIRKQDEKQEIATLFFRVQSRPHKFDMLFSSQIRVNVKEWREATSSPEKLANHRLANFKLHDTLNRIEIAVKSEIRSLNFDKAKIEDTILSIANPKKHKAKWDAINAEKNAEHEEMKAREEQIRIAEEALRVARANIWGYLDRFCRDIKSGARRNGAELYNPNTVKAWNSFRTLYDDFDKRHKYTWDAVDRDFVLKFMAYMEKKGYMVTAINKYIVSFRALVGYAYADGLHGNDRAMMCFSKRKVDERDKAAEIYLTESELQALYEMKLEGLQDQVRDLFLVGCYTCQRVSDYTNISKESFTTTARGTKVIRIFQQKTGTEVKIPIMNTNLRKICEKYDYKLPHVVDVIINRYIKVILKELSDTVPSLAVKVPTRLTMKQRAKVERGELNVELNDKCEVIVPRYDCVTTHTARRSGITNMYLSHKYNMVQMMHVSGHKTQKVFTDYIKLSSDELKVGEFQ